jgi:acyl carrier protein
MASGETERQLVEYIEKEVAYDRAGHITADQPLLDGLIDSTSMLRLVLFIEERFGVRVEDDELVPENFETIRRLTEFVERKQI